MYFISPLAGSPLKTPFFYNSSWRKEKKITPFTHTHLSTLLAIPNRERLTIRHDFFSEYYVETAKNALSSDANNNFTFFRPPVWYVRTAFLLVCNYDVYDVWHTSYSSIYILYGNRISSAELAKVTASPKWSTLQETVSVNLHL